LQAATSQLSDNDLLKAIARGDEAALAGCYDRYRLILFSLILRILHDRHEAEDVLQEVFLQVWRRARDFDESRGRAFTWLVTIARSRALDRLRSSGARARLITDTEPEPRDSVSDAAADAAASRSSVTRPEHNLSVCLVGCAIPARRAPKPARQNPQETRSKRDWLAGAARTGRPAGKPGNITNP